MKNEESIKDIMLKMMSPNKLGLSLPKGIEILGILDINTGELKEVEIYSQNNNVIK